MDRDRLQHLVYISIVGVDRIPFNYYRAKYAAERGPEVQTGGEVAADPARPRAAPRHLPDRVSRALERRHEPPTEMTGSAGDQYVHGCSLS